MDPALKKRLEFLTWQTNSDPKFHAQLIGTKKRASSTGSFETAVENLAMRIWFGHNRRAQFSPTELRIADSIRVRPLMANIYEARRRL